MRSTTQVRHLAPALIDSSVLNPTESAPSRERDVYKRHWRNILSDTPSSGLESARPRRYEIDIGGVRVETPIDQLTVRNLIAYRSAVGIPLPTPDAILESWLVAQPATARGPSRAAARKSWLQDAHEQLENLDVDALEEGLEPPSAEARSFAKKFLRELARVDLPLASVFADEDRAVSIQMEVTGFFFLLTCFEGGSGIYNVAHQTYRFRGSYKGLAIAEVAESEFLQHLRCLIKPLRKDARHTDRPE